METSIVKVAFYKHSKTFFGRCIRLKQYHFEKLPWRDAQYSHVEIVFSDGYFFSSSEQDGGTRFKKIDPKDGHWDFIEIEVTKEKERRMREFAEKQSGQKYAWRAIFFAQMLNFNRHRNGNWFCSQIVCRILQEACMICGESAHFVSPGKLHSLLEK